MESMALESPREVSPASIKAILDITEKPTLDSIARFHAGEALSTFAGVGLAQAQSAVAQVAENTIGNGKRWSAMNVRLIAAIAHDYPQATGVTIVGPLIRRMESDDRVLSYAAEYSQLVQANPDLADPAALARLGKAADDPTLHAAVRDSANIAIARFAAIRRDLPQHGAISKCWDLLRSRPSGPENSLIKAEAFAALADAAAAGAIPSPDVAQLLSFYTTDGWLFEFTREVPERTLTAVARLCPRSAIYAAVRMDIDAAAERADPLLRKQGAAVRGLLMLAKFAPAEVLASKARLYNIRNAEEVGLHPWIVATIARATYETLKIAKPARLEKDLLMRLQESRDRDMRWLGDYGLLFLALDDPSAQVRLSPVLRRLSRRSSPEVRIAANRAIEMLRIALLVTAARSDRRLIPLNRSKLRFLQQYPDAFVRLTADICLEDL